MKEIPKSEYDVDMLRAKLYQEYEKNNPPPSRNDPSSEWLVWEENRNGYVSNRLQQEQHGASDHVDTLRAQFYTEYAETDPPPSATESSEKQQAWEKKRSDYVNKKLQQAQHGASDHSTKGHIYKNK